MLTLMNQQPLDRPCSAGACLQRIPQVVCTVYSSALKQCGAMWLHSCSSVSPALYSLVYLPISCKAAYSLVNILFANIMFVLLVRSLRTVLCEPSLVSFFGEHKECSWLSGYSVRLNFCSLPCLQKVPISPTVFMQLSVVPSWFVIFPWFVGSSWKNKFSDHVCEHNVCKGIRSFTYSVSSK